ncbi:TPA: glucokinase [Stenotrophomonas maltophilia]|nr:glucokinase [Stenotrophomonas maltophilia]HDS1026449.1 glucokinase [Stenotrophomonas maltophilia]HDS1031807.1 glucokinase [Stenotrophomonas maltophilia]HDS1035560.1 glucokinase [Stenotrophomonas maltophilia]HDS1040697.1 glucokinase [Stenotrophomonas maltophilia]
MTASHPAPAHVLSRVAPSFLAADVGGTHVRVARAQASGDQAHPVQLLEYRKYRNADYTGLSAILSDFLGDSTRPSQCVVATAGFAREDGTVITANLPWPLSARQVEAEVGLQHVHIVNDFEAVAYAAAQVDASGVLHLCGPDTAARGPTLVVGPGTGLGAALWIPTPNGPVVLATEAGQPTLAASTELEMAIVRHMQRDRAHVSIEHALSGPGLMNLYHAVCALQGQTATLASPDAVTAAAMAGSDAMARQALDVFCGLLGSTIGDMALFYGAQGGVYLAGGILPQIREYLHASTFVERYLQKGPMGEALARIPVKVVEHGQLGVIGAASWFLLHANA